MIKIKNTLAGTEKEMKDHDINMNIMKIGHDYYNSVTLDESY